MESRRDKGRIDLDELKEALVLLATQQRFMNGSYGSTRCESGGDINYVGSNDF